MLNLNALRSAVLAALWMSALAVAGEGTEGPGTPTAPAPSPAPAPTPKPGVKPAPTPQEVEEPEARRPASGIPSLRMSTDFAAPGMSFGTYTPLGQVESYGVRVSPFTVRAALNTGLGYTDNAALTETNKVSSMFLTVNPSIAVGLEGALSRYYLIYRGNYGHYFSSSGDNYDDHNIALSAANDWTSRLRTLGTYDYARGHTPRGIALTGLSAPVEWDAHTMRVTGSYGADGAPGRVEGSTHYRVWRYATNRDAFASADYDEFGLTGTVSYRIAPKTRGLLEIGYTDFTHPNNRAVDSYEMRYLVGATWEALATTRGTVRAGLLTRKFDDASQSDFSGTSLDATVTWSPRTYSVVDLTVRRFLSEAYLTGASVNINNYASAVWNHDWSHGYRSTITYSYGRSTFEGIARTDSYNEFGVRGSYGITRTLRVGAEVRHDSRNSDAAGALTYKRNLILMSVETAI